MGLTVCKGEQSKFVGEKCPRSQ